MATWGDLGKLTHEQMETFTHEELQRLTLEQIQKFVNDVWPVLAALTPADRADFQKGLLNQTLPPALLADGETHYTPAQGAALKIWGKQPMTRTEVAAWLGVIGVAIQIMQAQFKEEPVPVQPPPAVEIIVQMPDQLRGICDMPPTSAPNGQDEAPSAPEKRTDPAADPAAG